MLSDITLSIVYAERRIFVVMPSDINLNDIMLGVHFCCYAEFTLIVVYAECRIFIVMLAVSLV